MTRIFDALRKARSAGGMLPPALESLPPSPRVAEQTAKPVLEMPPVSSEMARRTIVPLRPATALPTDLVREMAGLRVRLENMLTEHIPRTVMFLASQGGEGTSTVTAEFAQALAVDPRLRVLVVDTHARRPAYGTDGSWLAGGLGRPDSTGGNDASAAENLDVLPVPEVVVAAGGAAPQVLQNLLQAIAGGYDWILLDGPPVLESPDAAPLGQAVDGVIVVAQAGRTKRPVLARSVDLLNRSGGRVLGIVLNRRRLEIPEFIYRRI